MASDATAEDQGEFVGLTNGAIGVEEPLLESVDGARRRKIKLSQNSTWAKNSRC
jgi:hypothetical protein